MLDFGRRAILKNRLLCQVCGVGMIDLLIENTRGAHSLGCCNGGTCFPKWVLHLRHASLQLDVVHFGVLAWNDATSMAATIFVPPSGTDAQPLGTTLLEAGDAFAATRISPNDFEIGEAKYASNAGCALASAHLLGNCMDPKILPTLLPSAFSMAPTCAAWILG